MLIGAAGKTSNLWLPCIETLSGAALLYLSLFDSGRCTSSNSYLSILKKQNQIITAKA
jgi:hypothetical protein